MGRQWLHAIREINSQRRSKLITKYLREITVAAKLGGGDPHTNARLQAAIERAKKESIPKDNIERAIGKGIGSSDNKDALELVIFEGYAPHKIPVIVEALTDNHNRTAAEIRLLFKKGQLGTAGSNKFLFDHVGIVEAHHPDRSIDIEAAAIESGANDFEALTHAQNDEIPENSIGAKFITDRTATHAVASWLKEHGWTVITAEIGYIPKMYPPLDDAQRQEVGEFLQALDEHDDVHRIWAAIR
ncbi:MAG: YebC/PmpR family DNA-binding transcriptional regulator [Methylacidiphilales bacterium]|nr:YebC/PmpR family DNA-binding transcriptional regulator [Candidatus Methylacidiphilales bacterium]MDW8350002.1 YebC/PmpR family DNA-binding transcriptional regulator [Verrucomicrobiae bacterium]